MAIRTLKTQSSKIVLQVTTLLLHIQIDNISNIEQNCCGKEVILKYDPLDGDNAQRAHVHLAIVLIFSATLKH